MAVKSNQSDKPTPRKPCKGDADADDRLDEELEDTFPASDPPSHTPCRPVRDDHDDRDA